MKNQCGSAAGSARPSADDESLGENEPTGAHLSDVSGVTRKAVLWHAIRDRGRGRALVFATLGLMVHQAAEALVPVLLGVTIDRAIATRDLGQLWLCLTALAVTFLVLSLSYQRSSYTVVGIYSWGEHDLRQRSLARLLHPRGMEQRYGAGTALSIMTSDSYRVAGVVWSIAQQASTLAAVLVSGVVLMRISVPLGIGVYAGALIMLWSMQRFARPLERVGMAEQASVANASEIAGDVVAGLRIVHGLRAQQEMSRRYREASDRSRRGAVRAARLLLGYTALSSIFSVVFLALVALAAGLLVATGDVTAGQLVTVVGVAQFLQNSLAHIGTFGANWAHKRASATRMKDFLSNPYLLDDGAHACASQNTQSGPGEGMSAYTAADDVSDAPQVGTALTPLLDWRDPERVGIESDEWSTRLVVPPDAGLIGVRVGNAASVPQARAAERASETIGLRRRPDEGELLVDGRSALEGGPEHYRRKVVAPPRYGHVFTGTLAENVAGPGRTVNERISSAVAADEILDRIGGVDIEIGENGRRLSGGQRQRVLMARALHADAELVVLHEPTIALDPITEQRVASGLRDLDRPIVVFTSSRILLDACVQVIDLDLATEGR